VWITVYLITAVVVAVLTWHLSHHVQSLEGPTDAARGFWAIVAGAGWPVILLGVAEMLVIHLITRRLRHAPATHAVTPALPASDSA
jgi:predicted phage tail protein